VSGPVAPAARTRLKVPVTKLATLRAEWAWPRRRRECTTSQVLALAHIGAPRRVAEIDGLVGGHVETVARYVDRNSAFR
jgi:hypothetical protein